MCFIIEKGHATAIVAEKPVHCYKIVIPEGRGTYTSQWRDFPYQNGKLYKGNGLLSRYRIGCELYGEGIHSYTNLEIAKDNVTSGGIIIHCEIPKGTRYYENPFDQEFISDNIKIIGKTWSKARKKALVA